MYFNKISDFQEKFREHLVKFRADIGNINSICRSGNKPIVIINNRSVLAAYDLQPILAQLLLCQTKRL